MKEKYTVGQIVKCRVTGITSYGIFVSINPYYNGLIHISEVSSGYVRNLDDYTKVGDTIYAKIIDVNTINNHLKLSIKDIDYRKMHQSPKVKESKNGFQPLKDNLSIWTEEKIKEYNLK